MDSCICCNSPDRIWKGLELECKRKKLVIFLVEIRSMLNRSRWGGGEVKGSLNRGKKVWNNCSEEWESYLLEDEVEFWDSTESPLTVNPLNVFILNVSGEKRHLKCRGAAGK